MAPRRPRTLVASLAPDDVDITTAERLRGPMTPFQRTEHGTVQELKETIVKPSSTIRANTTEDELHAITMMLAAWTDGERSETNPVAFTVTSMRNALEVTIQLSPIALLRAA